MTKALFFDIDGTLVSFKTHRVSDETANALAEAKKNGCGIFISTGRPNIIIDNLDGLTRRNLIDGYITMNGCYCFVGDDVIYKSALRKDEAATILKYCQDRNTPVISVGKDRMAVCQDGELVQKIFKEHLRVKEPIPTMSTEEILAWDEIYQLTPFITAAQEKELVLPHCELSRWHPSFTDVTAIGNTKSNGMDVILNHFGLSLKDTLSFGDGGNDVSMLEHAAIGVAMGNASDEVKQHADFITKTVDEEGIKFALQHFGIIE